MPTWSMLGPRFVCHLSGKASTRVPRVVPPLYVDAADGEQVLSHLLTNQWNARRGHQKTLDSCLHVFVFLNLACAEDH